MQVIVSPETGLQLPDDIDSIVVLGYTTVAERQPEGYHQQALSQVSLWAADAAAYAADVLPDATIALATESTFRQHGASTATFIERRLAERGIDTKRCRQLGAYAGKALRDTPLQMAALSRAFVGKNLIVGMDFHTPRAGLHAAGYDMDFYTVNADDILRTVDYDGILPDPDVMGGFSNWQESLATRIAQRFPKGRLLSIGSYLQGPRLHHVEIDPVTQEQTAVMTTARRYIRKNGIDLSTLRTSEHLSLP